MRYLDQETSAEHLFTNYQRKVDSVPANSSTNIIVESAVIRADTAGKKSKQKKASNKKNKYASSAGFGGAATAPCPCGSGLGYMKCCGKLHKDATAFAVCWLTANLANRPAPNSQVA